MDDTKCLSDRTLRYGRNLNLLSFITLGVVLFNIPIHKAQLFGINPDEKSIWTAILMLFVYHFVSFLILVYIDFPKWWGANIYLKLPHWKNIFHLKSKAAEGKDDIEILEMVKNKNTYIWQNLSLERKFRSKLKPINKTEYHAIRRTLYHTVAFDFGIPVILSLISVWYIIFCYI